MKNVFFNSLLLLVFFSSLLSCTKDDIQEDNGPAINYDTLSRNGLILMDRHEYDLLPELDVSTLQPLLPELTSNRSSKVQLNTPPVWDQGTEGSCVSFAVGYIGVSYYLKMLKNMPYSSTGAYRSPEFLYNNTKISGNCNTGSHFTNVLNFLKSSGVCSWSQMPYSSSNGCTNKGTQVQKEQAKAGKIKSWTKVSNSVSTLRNLLYYGYPVLLGMPLDRNFDVQTKSFPYTYTSRGGSITGGHAMVIVGYDDQKKVFKVQNSWGKNVHDNGFLYISYNLMPLLNAELYYIDPIR